MVKLINLTDHRNTRDQFIKYGWEKQRSLKNSIPVFFEYERDLLSKRKNFFFSNGGTFNGFIAIDSNNTVVGRIGAMINNRIESESKLGLIGLFQVSEDYDIAKALIDKAVFWLKGQNCKRIWGPMDFSIWNRYRFAVDSFESKPVIGEPRNPSYYPLFFERYGFMRKYHWQSVLVDKDFMADYVNRYYDHKKIFDEAGYKEIFMNSKNQSEIIDIIYGLLSKSFNRFPAYTPITKEQFQNLFIHIPQMIDRKCTRFFKNPEGKYVGFVVVLKDLSDVIGIMRGKKNLKAKIDFALDKNHSEIANLYIGGVITGAIRESIVRGKEIAGKGLSLTHVAHCGVFNSILSSGDYKYVLVTLRRSGTAIHNHTLGDPKTNRNYYLYELNLAS